MGGSLFDEFRSITQIADSVLGYSIKQLCLEDPAGQLDNTEFAQPALYVVNALSYFKKMEELEPDPDFLVGHSLGEINALMAGKAFDFETGLRLVRRRGELMSRAPEGAMAAVLNTSEEQVRAILERSDLNEVDLANFNTPTQVVISGSREDIDAAQLAFHDGRHLFVRLNTSGAFHSRAMAKVEVEFRVFLDSFSFADPIIPVLSNVAGQRYRGEHVKEYLSKQIAHPVRWSATVESLLDHPGMEFEEIGHGTTLAKLVKRIRRETGRQGRHSDTRA